MNAGPMNAEFLLYQIAPERAEMGPKKKPAGGGAISWKTAYRSMYHGGAPEPADMDPDRLAAEGVVQTDAG